MLRICSKKRSQLTWLTHSAAILSTEVDVSALLLHLTDEPDADRDQAENVVYSGVVNTG